MTVYRLKESNFGVSVAGDTWSVTDMITDEKTPMEVQGSFVSVLPLFKEVKGKHTSGNSSKTKLHLG